MPAAPALSGPTPAEVAALARELGLALEPTDAAEYSELASGFLAGVALLDQVSEQFPPPRYARGAVGAPAAAENP
ncbi:MAG TPA: hypothetical protein VHQ66_11270, partial [Myxococcota bacterium]|nr:hypothetical protein [Myxococcota bacterium]